MNTESEKDYPLEPVPSTLRKGEAMRDESGFYRLPNGKIYPSVTTILGPLDDFLFVHLTEIRKAVESLKRKLMAGEQELTWHFDQDWQMVESDPFDCLTSGHYISNAGLRFMKACADRGSLLHELLGDYAAGAALGDPEERVQELIIHRGYSCSLGAVLPYAKSLVSWLAAKRPHIAWSERVVFSDTHQYAGRPDGLMHIPGLHDEYLPFDLKSQAAHKASRAHFAQVSAYSFAEFILDGDGASSLDIAGRPCVILYVTPDRAGTRLLENPEYYFHGLFLPQLQAFTASKEGLLPGRAEWVKQQ